MLTIHQCLYCSLLLHDLCSQYIKRVFSLHYLTVVNLITAHTIDTAVVNYLVLPRWFTDEFYKLTVKHVSMKESHLGQH